jgi:plasmid replication initiation protein
VQKQHSLFSITEVRAKDTLVNANSPPAVLAAAVAVLPLISRPLIMPTSTTAVAAEPTDSIFPQLQLALQYEPTGTSQVKQHHHVTFSRQRKMSVFSKRIMAKVLEQINEGDTELREFYQLRVDSLVEGTKQDKSNAYAYSKKAVYELAHVQWEFEDLHSDSYYVLSLLDTTKKRRVGVHEGVITIMLNPELAPYFLKIAGQYSVYKLDGYMGLSSWYAMRLFEILSFWKDTGWWQVSIEEYRQLMDCGPELDKFGQPKVKKGVVKMKLAKTTHLIEQTVLTAQKELANTPYAFTYEAIEAKQAKGRPKIVAIRFELVHKVLTKIPSTWLSDPNRAPIIQKLQEFRISEGNIAKYLNVLGQKECSRLLREWQLKENSSQKIDDRAKYCNAAFVRHAKALIEARKQEVTEAKQIAQHALFGQRD